MTLSARPTNLFLLSKTPEYSSRNSHVEISIFPFGNVREISHRKKTNWIFYCLTTVVKPENPFPFFFVCPRCKEHREEWTHADSSLPCIGSFIFLLDPTFSIHLPICPPCRATWCMNWDSNSSSGRSGVCFCLKKSQAGPCPRVQK